MSLRRLCNETSHRQYLIWMVWLEKEWNQPTRTDYYLMQIAQEVRRMFSKKPLKILLEHFKLRWGPDTQKAPALSKEEATVYAKARWFALTGFKSKRKRGRK